MLITPGSRGVNICIKSIVRSFTLIINPFRFSNDTCHMACENISIVVVVKMHSLLSCVSYDELRELDKLSELKFKVELYVVCDHIGISHKNNRNVHKKFS